MADLRAGRAVGVERRLVALLRLVEAEAVAPAVPGAVELLQQEDHGLVDDPQHPQPVDTCRGDTRGLFFSGKSSQVTHLLPGSRAKVVPSPSKDTFWSCALVRASCTLSVNDFQASVDRTVWRRRLSCFYTHSNNNAFMFLLIHPSMISSIKKEKHKTAKQMYRATLFCTFYTFMSR